MRNMPRRIHFNKPMDPVKTEKSLNHGAKKTKPAMKLLCLPPTMWQVIGEYCQQASLHGLRYISSTDLPYIERYLWLAVFLLCLGFSIHLIYEVWALWRDKPFFITFDSHMTPIWTIPFPSVTICSSTNVKKSFLDLSTTKNETLMFYASLTCLMGGSLRKKLTAPEKVGNEVYDFLLKASPSCDEMLKVCTFQGHPFNCCEAFEPVMTDFGLCYSFNKLPSEIIFTESTHKPYPGRKYPPGAVFWNPDDGYPVDDKTRYLNKEKVFPVWSQVSGENTGLGVELYQNKSDWQRLCTGGYTGFQVKLTNAANFPVFTKVDERLALNRETSLMLTPLLLGSHPELANIPTRIRSCYFTDEKQLHFFKTYTYENCNLECTTLFTINECNCVPIEYMHWNDTRICSTPKDFLCLQIAKGKMSVEAMGRDKNSFSSPCNCLQGCQEIVYKATDFYTNYVYTGREPIWANGTYIGPNSVTRLTVYFRSSQFLGQHRVMRYTALKFAGTCGGLLSLLLGFSVISVVEIFYAFLLRPLNRALLNFYNRRRTNVIVVKPPEQKQQQNPTQLKQKIFSVTGIYSSQRVQFMK